MTVHETLRRAITMKLCVRVRTGAQSRDLCPHALGIKNGHPRLLAFQYDGNSVSGLAEGGQWRAFYIRDITEAALIDGGWHTGPSLVAKAETCLDRIEYLVRN